jgi:L-ribulose-5-phosphate 3-epimerase
LASMCLSGQRKFPMGSADPALRARSLEIIKNAVDLAADLGIRLIQIAGYDVYYEPSTEATRAMFTQNLGAAVEFAASRGVVLAFETMETPFMNTVAKALSFVESIDSPYLQIYPDVGNVTNALEGDAARARADLEGGKGHIAATHLKETAPGIFREVPYGRGHVNFDACIAGAANAGARMFVAEFWYAGATDWKAEIVRANSFLRPKLDAYFSAR